MQALLILVSYLALADLSESQHWYSSPEWWLCIIGIPTLIGILIQAKATADAAKATEQLVVDGRLSSQEELRAYLTVIIGTAIYQERRPQQKGGDLRFECRPLLLNTGKTPAKKLSFVSRAAILPQPLPQGTHLSEGFNEGNVHNILGPGQNATMYATVEGFCQDNDVQKIKEGFNDKALYVWGLIKYEDIFGKEHFTRFCQHIFWDRKNNVRGFYVPGRNDMD